MIIFNLNLVYFLVICFLIKIKVLEKKYTNIYFNFLIFIVFYINGENISSNIKNISTFSWKGIDSQNH